MSPAETELHCSFLRLFTTNEEAVRAFVRRLVPARADADDVMQEVSIVLWKKFGSFHAGTDFRAWAFGVARFEVLGWLRDKGRDRLVLDEGVALKLAHEAEALEPALSRQREALERCMEKIPPEQRSLLMRAYQPEARIQEVAATSGRSIAGFYQWLHRRRKALLDCIHAALVRGGSS
jgi:RNA polymerase sigma-70 factor (ECF subfamily)